MNPQPTDQELERLIAAHGPSRAPRFHLLRPHIDLIRALRAKGASAETLRLILRAREVRVCETTVRNFLREVLAEAPVDRRAGRRTTPRARRLSSPAPPPSAAPSPECPPDSPQPGGRGPRIANLKRTPHS